MSTMSEWTAAVCRELGLPESTDTDGATKLVLDVTGDVARGVTRPAAPVTAFLLGLAAGRADDPVLAARDHAERISALAATWNADTDRT
ncbi:MAG: DUF6457 domain-containing protein [Pseudonocardia sp.]